MRRVEAIIAIHEGHILRPGQDEKGEYARIPDSPFMAYRLRLETLPSGHGRLWIEDGNGSYVLDVWLWPEDVASLARVFEGYQ